MIDRLAAVRPRTFLILVVAVAAVAILLFLVWPGPRVEELGGGPILDTRGFDSGRDAAAYVETLGQEGRRLYAVLLVGDMLWAVLHGVTLAIGIAVGMSRAGRQRLVTLAWLPLVYIPLDLAENVSFLAAIRAHPQSPPVPDVVMGMVTVTKFTFVGLGYLALTVALIMWWRTDASGHQAA